jgi:transposase-like protein
MMATPRSTRDPLFLGRWFEDEVIIVALRWYLIYLSPQLSADLRAAARSRVLVAPSTVIRWVLRYTPAFEKRWRPYEKPVGLSWRVDETYSKVAGQWTYLYRAVDAEGRTVDFFLSKQRDVRAAKALFRHALCKHGDPLSITLDALIRRVVSQTVVRSLQQNRFRRDQIYKRRLRLSDLRQILQMTSHHMIGLLHGHADTTTRIPHSFLGLSAG